MFDLTSTRSHRRGFLGRLGTLAALGLIQGPRELLAAAAPSPKTLGPEVDTKDLWLQRLHGKHRQLFDMPNSSAGVPLLHIRNYLNTYTETYNLADTDINAVGTFYGKTIPLGFPDEMWAKYHFGQALELTDPGTKGPLERNMFAHPKEGDPFALGFLDSSIESLMHRGVTFIMCNNALNFWVGKLSGGGMGTKEAIRADLLVHLTPGIVLVPAMVIAVNKAQEAGLTYMYLA